MKRKGLRVPSPGPKLVGVARIRRRRFWHRIQQQRSWQRGAYKDIIKQQFRSVEMKRLMKGLAWPGEILIGHRISDQEFLWRYQLSGLVRRHFSYRFAGILQAVAGLGLFREHWLTTRDLYSVASSCRFGHLLKNYDGAEWDVSGVRIQLRVRGRRNQKRFVIVAGLNLTLLDHHE